MTNFQLLALLVAFWFLGWQTRDARGGTDAK